MAEWTMFATDDNLPVALGYVEEELDKNDCPMKSSMQIMVCLEEMFVNVAHYAYSGDPGEITISVEISDKCVSITLIDSGMPFNPLAKTDPDITLSAEERNIGGLGIYMVKKSMDQVSYQREYDKNVFTMKKEI